MPLAALMGGSAPRDARLSPCFGSPVSCCAGGPDMPWPLGPGDASAGSCSTRCIDAALAPMLPAIATSPTGAARKRKAATPGCAIDLLACAGGHTGCSAGPLSAAPASKRACLAGDKWGATSSGPGEGLLLCEEGLEAEAEDAGRAGSGAAAGCSPAWDGATDDDAPSLPGSESGSQYSAGSTFLLPADLRAAEEEGCSPPEDAAWLSTSGFSETPSPRGDFTYRRVPAASLIGAMAAMYGFTPFTVAVGTSYFERLAARDAPLLAAARATPDFAPFVASTPAVAPVLPKSPGVPLHTCQGPRHWLTAVHLACIYVAAKNVEYVPYKRLLQTMLSHVHGCEVSAEAAAVLEVEVLQGLDWRLGPFFRTARQLCY